MTQSSNAIPVSGERLAEMLAGLKGVTPGPWDTAVGLVRSIDGDEAIPIFETRAPWKKHRRTSTVVKQEWHNRHHIARCDPDTMRSILTELITLRATKGELVQRYETALAKISAIRDSIIGFQNVGWSEHIYPIVSALHEAGYDGIGYDKARENVSTMLDITKAAQARADAAEEARVRISYALYGEGNDPGHALHAVTDALIAVARTALSRSGVSK